MQYIENNFITSCKKKLNIFSVSFFAGCLMLAACSHINNADGMPCAVPLAKLTAAEQEFAVKVAPRYGVTTAEATLLLSQVQFQKSIIQSMTRPSEKKSWGDYRTLLLTPARIAAGKNFIQDHAAVFAEAQQRYGVSPQIIASILGIETFYGKHLGKYRVLDALATLAFEYPKRSAFFQKELAQYMRLLVKNPEYISQKGSYAGACGMPQFMPSSYVNTAVSSQGTRAPDLYQADDAILSVAHYFKMNGWQQGDLVAVRVKLAPATCARLSCDQMKPRYTVAQWKNAGVQVPSQVSNKLLASVVRLHMDDGPEAWMVFHNFYVITRYNNSINYAMAAFELSQALR